MQVGLETAWDGEYDVSMIQHGIVHIGDGFGNNTFSTLLRFRW